MKKLFVLLFVSVIILAGCATSATDEKTCDSNDPAITFITDGGTIDDKSFNQSAWEGITKYCTENDISATYIESNDTSELDNNLGIASEQSEVVVAAGFYFSTPVYNAASENPDVDYILIDAEPMDDEGNVKELDNIETFLFNEADAGYLVGYIAGSKTKNDHIGFIGGDKVPTVSRFGYGYIAGAQAANKDIEIDFNYVGSFNDAAKGKTTANTMYGQGSDIIFAAAGGTSDGVVQAGIESQTNGEHNWVIGVDRDVYDSGLYTNDDGKEKSAILTSAIKKVDIASYQGLSNHFEGNFDGGTTVLDYSSGGVGLPETNPNLEDDKDIIDNAYKSLENYGKTPQTANEVDKLVTIKINGEY